MKNLLFINNVFKKRRNKINSFVSDAPIYFIANIISPKQTELLYSLDIGSIEIDWGDGVVETIVSNTDKVFPATSSSLSHSYSKPNNYLVQIRGDVDKIRSFVFNENSSNFSVDSKNLTGLSGCYVFGSQGNNIRFDLNDLDKFPSLRSIQLQNNNIYGDISNFDIYETLPYIEINGGSISGDIKNLLEKPMETALGSTVIKIYDNTGLYFTTCTINSFFNNRQIIINNCLSKSSIDNLIKSLDTSIVSPSTGQITLGDLNPRTTESSVEYNSLISKGYEILPTVEGIFPVIQEETVVENYDSPLTEEAYYTPLTEEDYYNLLI